VNGSGLQKLGGEDLTLNNIVSFALFLYLGTLAITQTAYGDAFMSARWLALGLLLFTAGFYWLSTKRLKLSRNSDTNKTIVLIYLCMTFVSVVTAENPLFSGLKWVSHAGMIVIFLVFLWQSLSLKQVSQALNILKWLIVLLITLSWLKPVSTVLNDVELFRGAFGSPNSMGQVAAIGCLLFLHSFLTSNKRRWVRRAEIVMVCVAAWLVWSSGARSAVVASIAGLALMSYFYPSKLRGKVLWVALLAGGLAFVVPDIPKTFTRFVLRGESETRTFSEWMFRTRASIWTAAWEGFKKRPVFGWGFGADDQISKAWEPKFTALGFVSRDSVNDTLIALESTGIVGLMAYIMLLFLAIKQIPTRQERFLIRRMHGPPFSQIRRDLSAYHNHAIAFSISMSLFVTVQFDNTALSAGNFVSVTLWLCVAVAGAIKSKAVAYESTAARYRDLHKHLQSEPRQDSPISASVIK
jgi:O-antigen ligase